MPKSRKYQRKKRKLKQKRKRSVFSLLGVIFVIVLLLSIILFFWKVNSLEKFSYVTKEKSGGIEVVTIDPKNNNLESLFVPGDTSLDLSYNLGEYRLKNIWKLADSQGMGGDLVTKTIIKNFSIPVYLYKNGSDSNLGPLKEVRVWMIDKKLSRINAKKYDLSQTSALRQENLLDGEEGYVVSGAVPSYAMVSFSVSDLEGIAPKAEIIDASGDFKISDSISLVLSTMGIKVSSYSKISPGEFNCSVGGKNKDLLEKVALVFDCTKNTEIVGESDIQILIGEDFVNKF